MNIKLKTERTFSFDIGPRHFDGYREESRWHGFTRYEKGASWLIVPTAGFPVVDILFGDSRELPLVSASPDIIAAVEHAEKAAPDAAQTVQ